MGFYRTHSTSLAAKSAPDTFCVQYGNFRFPNGTLTEEFRCEPILDESQRTIIYSKFRITVSAYVNYGSGTVPTDSICESALEELNHQGLPFIYTGRGVGMPTINLRSGATDCIWGPIPRVVSFEPKSGISTKIIWTIEFHIPYCQGARYVGPMEFCYGTQVSIDKHHLTTRTYSGFIRIAQNRIAPMNRRVLKSADEWRNKINPPKLVGFRRIPGDFKLSFDKCRLDFTIRDEELPSENAPPENVIEVEADMSYTTTQPGRLFEWTGRLNALYSGEKGNRASVPASIAAFKATAEDRLKSS